MTLESILLNHQNTIEYWFQEKENHSISFVYSSIDIRNAGFKIAPIDTNIFPAGFNNLSSTVYPVCIEALKKIISQHYPNTKKILIIPENHTRNVFYFENIYVLYTLLQNAGYEPIVGLESVELINQKEIILNSDKKLIIHPIEREHNHNYLKLNNIIPDLILLNNDLSEGAPPLLQNLSQPIIPPIYMGWFNRSKMLHFKLYEQLVQELCSKIKIDSWLITPLFDYCDNISFIDAQAHNNVQEKLIPIVKQLLMSIQKKYEQYKIQQKPFVIIKSDTGTYGMAVMMVDSVESLVQLNRKQRLKMSVGKGKQPVTRVIIQEGIPSIDYINDSIAEPVIYNIGNTIVGGFYRVHPKKGPMDNLNAPGMHFKPLESIPYSYQVITRLAQLAASLENNTLSGKLYDY